MRVVLIVLAFVFFLTLAYFSLPALIPHPTVTKVRDGDTIELSNGKVIRYLGVDTPEKGECYATRSSELNRDLTLNKKVRIEYDKDRYDQFGRELAYVYATGKNNIEVMLNEELLQIGAGEFQPDKLNQKYQSRLLLAAESAHQASVGKWTACRIDNAPCDIKGNLDRYDKRYYHLPSYRHYSTVVVNLESWDRWFCSEEEAQKAGFRPARK